MLLTAEQFLQWPRRAITLLGMSGVGKTTLATRLPSTTWFHYSGDYRIGTRYLDEPILDNIKRQAMRVDFLRHLLRSDSIYICSNITVTNLAPISSFLGKLGSVTHGGLSLEEFRHRQRLHGHAETCAMVDVAEFIDKAKEIYGYDHFINDAGGSICELDDPRVFETLSRHTLILYLRAGEDMESELVRRAAANPKPLFYREDFLERELSTYLKERGIDAAEWIVPDDFVRWIFPRLLQHRRPRYEALATRFGYAVDAREISSVRDEQDFLQLVAGAIRRRPT
jgi:hypothetical protein